MNLCQNCHPKACPLLHLERRVMKCQRCHLEVECYGCSYSMTAPREGPGFGASLGAGSGPYITELVATQALGRRRRK